MGPMTDVVKVTFCNGCSCPIRPAQWASPLVYCGQLQCQCHSIWWSAVRREQMREQLRGGKSLVQRLWEVLP